jgi:hypothetical protein
MTPEEEADQFVRSWLLNGKCNAINKIMKAALDQGFTRAEIHAAYDRNPYVHFRGRTRDNGCWRLVPGEDRKYGSSA